MSFSDEIEPSPYAPPVDVTGATEMPCPNCGDLMDDGVLASGTSIRWRSNSRAKLKTFLTGGESIGETQSGFGYRIPAFYCPSCRLVMMKP